MPGIAGIISHEQPMQCQAQVHSMISAMLHEPFYCSGTYLVPDLGIYTGWVAHDDSFAAGRVFGNATNDIAIVLAGECFGDFPICYGSNGSNKASAPKNHRLVDLYEADGSKCFERLNGVFSGLLIDQRQKQAFLFNDRYGAERIYWHQTDDAIFFASEAKALLGVLSDLRSFDEEGVAQFLALGCTVEDRTLFKGVRLLPAGSLWTFREKSCQKGKYFSPSQWESQEALSANAFQREFGETFKRVLPRYFQSRHRIGISLTAGLDTRMIMACRPATPKEPICYTFSGAEGLTYDDQVARQVAQMCGLEHRLLRIGGDFFSNFDRYADRTVYITDGCLGVTGSHEIYLNQQARDVAPIRLTGNYGSEVLRGVSTFGRLNFSAAILNPEWRVRLAPYERVDSASEQHPITRAASSEIPWSLAGTFLAARSQVIFRTPYLDNEIVSLAYRAPKPLRGSPSPAWDVIYRNDSRLARIPTDKGLVKNMANPVLLSRRLFREATFKLDYLNNEGWPHWLSPAESSFQFLTSALGIVARHKYLHYRTWFQDQLAEYVHNSVDNTLANLPPFWNQNCVRSMAQQHIRGKKNYVSELNAVLTLGAVQRLLLRYVPSESQRPQLFLSAKVGHQTSPPQS